MARANQPTLRDTVPQVSSTTHALMALKVQPGTYSVEFHASWMNETETGCMNPTAAEFWSTRADLLAPGCDVAEVLEELETEWDASTNGPLPVAGCPELDFDLENSEFDIVRQDVEIHIPLELFANDNEGSSPAPSSHSDATTTLPLDQLVSWAVECYATHRFNAARQRLSWAAATVDAPAESEVTMLGLDLIEKVGDAHRLHCDSVAAAEERIHVKDRAVAEEFMFPAPSPCSWEYTIGWKGSSGTVGLNVQRQTTLGELLRQQVSGDVGWIDGTLFVKDVEIDGQWVEWEEWNSKCADMVVTPP